LCLEEALKYTEEEIKAAEKRLAERKSQVEQTQAQPVINLIDARHHAGKCANNSSEDQQVLGSSQQRLAGKSVDDSWNQKETPTDSHAGARRIIGRCQQNTDKDARHESAENGQDCSFDPAPDARFRAHCPDDNGKHKRDDRDDRDS